MSDPAIVYVSGTTEAVKVTSSGAIDLVEVTTTYGGGSSGGGAVDSVNGQTGVVVLDAADVGAAEVVNVLDFGADPTGVADSWLAIQRAIYHASWQWQTVGWPAAEDLTGESETYDITVDGDTYAIPRIWAGQGHQKVYFPTGVYKITKSLVITHSTHLVGECGGQTIIQPDDAMRAACIITKNLAINLMHPQTAGLVDEYNANAYLGNFQIRRVLAGESTPTTAVGNLTEWLAITVDKLEGTAGNTILDNIPNHGYPLVVSGSELPIRLLHEVELFGDDAQIYTVTVTNAATTTITPALVTSTPVGGAQFLVGIPSIKGIFASGGEDFLIERVDTFLDHSAVGMMIVGGSPGPSIRNCMSSQNKVGFWVDNYPASLDCISGDDNEVFVKSGCLRWSNLTILNYKCETNRGDLFQFGGFYGSDPTIYNIVGGAANATAAAEVSGSAVFHVFLPNAANPGGFPIITSNASRFYINRTRMLKTTDRYGGFTVTSLDIPKASSQDYPAFLNWSRRASTLGGVVGIPSEALANPLSSLPFYTLPTATGYLALSDNADGTDSRLAEIDSATDAATPETIAKRDAAGSVSFVGVTASTVRVQATPDDFYTDINTQGSQSANRAQYTSDADGNLALTDSLTGIPDKLHNGTISGTVAFGTGADAAMMTALGAAPLVSPSFTTPAIDVATGKSLALSGQSLTGSQATSALDIFATWNTTGNPALIYGRITNTASGSTAKLLDLGTVAGGSLVNVDKTGRLLASSVGPASGDSLILTGSSTTQIVGVNKFGYVTAAAATGYGWSSNTAVTLIPDTAWWRLSAGVIGAGNGTPGTFGSDVKLRSILPDRTDIAAGTTGAATINKSAGSVNLAAAATSLVVTNSLVTANSRVMVTVNTNDTTCKSCTAVSAAGSFTIYPNAAPTAESNVSFLVLNP